MICGDGASSHHFEVINSTPIPQDNQLPQVPSPPRAGTTPTSPFFRYRFRRRGGTNLPREFWDISKQSCLSLNKAMVSLTDSTLWHELPKTRAEAKASGSGCYFNGKLCPHGHICPRRTSTGHCLICQKKTMDRWRDRHREKYRVYQRGYQKKYYDTHIRKPKNAPTV